MCVCVGGGRERERILYLEIHWAMRNVLYDYRKLTSANVPVDHIWVRGTLSVGSTS